MSETRRKGRAYPGTGRRNSVGRDEEVEAEVGKDVLVHGDDLESEHVLPTVVAHLEDGGLPGVEGLALAGDILAVEDGILRVDVHLSSSLAVAPDLEGRHEGSLSNEDQLSGRLGAGVGR